MDSSLLDSIAIVLVEPRGPLNVGSVARAMKNFGLSDLRLVGELDPREDECRLMASGSQDVLDRAGVFTTLADALADRDFVVGTTARPRHRRPTATPKETADEILDGAERGGVAILFGREDFGLSKEELILCHRVISIPTSSDRASLNLAQAVMIVAYELFGRAPVRPVTAHRARGALLDGRQWDRLYEEFIDCCRDTGYLGEGNRIAIEQSFRRLLKLGPIQTRDARHFFGLVRRVQKLLRGEVEPPPREH